MLKVFDFKCVNRHTTEKFVKGDTNAIDCPHCGEVAIKVIGNVNFKLDGCDPSYPTAWDRWATDHENRAKAERKHQDSTIS